MANASSTIAPDHRNPTYDADESGDVDVIDLSSVRTVQVSGTVTTTFGDAPIWLTCDSPDGWTAQSPTGIEATLGGDETVAAVPEWQFDGELDFRILEFL